MVTHNDSTPGRQGGMMAVRRYAAEADPAAARDADVAELLRQADTQLGEMQRLLERAAEQQFAVTTGTKVLAEMARQAQARLDAVTTAADEIKLDELADLLRRQSPARQRLLMETLEGGQSR